MAAAPPTVLPEYKLWEEHWCRCSHELGQWDTLNEFGKSHNGAKPFLGQDLCVFGEMSCILLVHVCMCMKKSVDLSNPKIHQHFLLSILPICTIEH